MYKTIHFPNNPRSMLVFNRLLYPPTVRKSLRNVKYNIYCRLKKLCQDLHAPLSVLNVSSPHVTHSPSLMSFRVDVYLTLVVLNSVSIKNYFNIIGPPFYRYLYLYTGFVIVNCCRYIDQPLYYYNSNKI